MRSLLVAVGSLVLANLLVGCGGAAPPVGAQAPVSSSGDAAGVTAELDQSERQLRLALGLPADAPGGAAQPSPPPPPPVAAPAAPQAVTEAKPEAPSAAAKSADPCQSACPALASMRRAATQLCGLAGGDDDRCKSANDRVKHAEQQVHARCPACAG